MLSQYQPLVISLVWYIQAWDGHFSTYDRQDVLKHVGIKKFYKNYSDIAEEYNELDIKKIFTEKKLQKQLAVAIDLISLHGAMSRKTATGKSEEVYLSYPAEFLTSEYAFNLDFFANNVIIKKNKIKT